MDIFDLIRKCQLYYYTLDTLADKLSLLLDKTKDDVLKELKNLVDLGELYVDDKGKVSISRDKGFYPAIVSLNKKGYGFAMVDGLPDFFIPANELRSSFDGDNCLVEITKKRGEDIEGRVVKILKRNTTNIVGTFIIGKSKNVVFPDDPRFPQIRISKGDEFDAQNNDKVYVKLNVDSIENDIVHGKIIEVLGKVNTPVAEQLSIIRSFNLVDKFDEKVINEAKNISQKVDIKKYKNRNDYTEQNIITIDGEDARDFDDAIAVERVNDGYKLYVHIADVSEYVVENSSIDKEAYRRGTSVYFPNMVIPMLPKELSNGICSLQENELRLTLSCEILMDKDCNVLSSEIKEGIIKSKHRMTYTEVQGILDRDPILIEKFKDVVDDIICFQEISNKLKKIKYDRGEIRMNLPEPFILENSEGGIVSIEKRLQDESHEIIESLMVVTNEVVAKTYLDKHLPFVYRVHEKPDEEKATRLHEVLAHMGINNSLDKDYESPKSYQNVIEKITNTPKEQTLTKLILRSLMKARYDSHCLGHFGIASENYCHFTSPIRRYPDLTIHRIIKSDINGVPIEEIKSKYLPLVDKISEQSSLTEKTADEAERTMDDYKQAVYMTKFLGEHFTGTISGIQEFGIFVELENGVEGMLKIEDLPQDEYVFDDLSLTIFGANHHYTIGDKVEVVVANVNTELRQIDFDLFGVEKGYSSKLFKNKVEKSKPKKTIKNFAEKVKNKARSRTKKIKHTKKRR